MEKYTLTQDVNVFGFQVKTFPVGIGEAFGRLMQKITDGKNRGYYGITKFDENGGILYYAVAEEKFSGEAERYGYERYSIHKADYLTVTIRDWRSNLHCIKDAFHDMMKDKRVDNTQSCIEWYKTDEEMLCMMQIDSVKELFTALDDAANELMNLLLPLSEDQLNKIPFKESWTAAQLATHVTKSNIGIARGLHMEGKVPDRDPAAAINGLKKTFLNFETKMKSPEFIVPGHGPWQKHAVITALKNSNEQLKEKRTRAGIYEMINLEIFGDITRFELLHFVLFHTQRHIHQLKNIIKHI